MGIGNRVLRWCVVGRQGIVVVGNGVRRQRTSAVGDGVLRYRKGSQDTVWSCRMKGTEIGHGGTF